MDQIIKSASILLKNNFLKKFSIWSLFPALTPNIIKKYKNANILHDVNLVYNSCPPSFFASLKILSNAGIELQIFLIASYHASQRISYNLFIFKTEQSRRS